MAIQTQPRKTIHPLTKPPLPKKGGKEHDQILKPPPDPERDKLRKWVAADSHIGHVSKLLKKYDLSRQRHPEIFALLERIDEHEREERLFLGVVGEFSSGKSTLLNALLRDDLLRTDVIQGTTAAATLLSHGTELTVTVLQLPSHPVIGVAKALWGVGGLPFKLFREKKPQSREEFRALIHESTSVEEVAQRVAQVNVTHPADCLKNGMVIVDLPGTNADNPRHGGVTTAALADVCDAAIVVVPADAPGSETLWGFLKNHTEPDVLRRCIFVLNKIDKIRRPADRARLSDDLKARLKLHLGIEKPRVVLAAPERILEAQGILPPPEEPEFAMSSEEQKNWVTMFQRTEQGLLTTLKEQKLLLQVERLARLLGQVFELLGTELQARQTQHQERHTALLEGLKQIPDLQQFVHDNQQKFCSSYVSQAKPIVQECWRNIRATNRKKY